MDNFTGVVLAGGKSRRMKTDKALINFKNTSLIEHQIKLLQSIFNKVIISANNQKYSFVGVNIIKDDIDSKGPIGGILSALKNSTTDYIFVLSVDLPFMSKEFIESMINNYQNFDITIPVNNGKYEPTCAIYNKTCIPIIEQQIRIKNNKLVDFINLCNTNFIKISTYSSLYSDKLFLNLNTPDQLKDLQ